MQVFYEVFLFCFFLQGTRKYFWTEISNLPNISFKNVWKTLREKKKCCWLQMWICAENCTLAISAFTDKAVFFFSPPVYNWSWILNFFLSSQTKRNSWIQKFNLQLWPNVNCILWLNFRCWTKFTSQMFNKSTLILYDMNYKKKIIIIILLSSDQKCP